MNTNSKLKGRWILISGFGKVIYLFLSFFFEVIYLFVSFFCILLIGKLSIMPTLKWNIIFWVYVYVVIKYSRSPTLLKHKLLTLKSSISELLLKHKLLTVKSPIFELLLKHRGIFVHTKKGKTLTFIRTFTRYYPCRRHGITKRILTVK